MRLSQRAHTPQRFTCQLIARIFFAVCRLLRLGARTIGGIRLQLVIGLLSAFNGLLMLRVDRILMAWCKERAYTLAAVIDLPRWERTKGPNSGRPESRRAVRGGLPSSLTGLGWLRELHSTADEAQAESAWQSRLSTSRSSNIFSVKGQDSHLYFQLNQCPMLEEVREP